MDITNWLEGTITVASAFLLYYFIQISSHLWILCLIPGLFAKHILWLPYIFATPIRDFKYFYKFFHIIRTAFKYKKNNINIIEMFKENLEKDPQKKCIYFEDKAWTYEMTEEFSNRVANVFAAEGFSKGDVVGLLMDNRLEYPGVWLGLAKLGVVTSLININLRQRALVHAIKIVDCKGLIVSQEHFSALGDIPLELVKRQHIYLFRDDPTKVHDSDKFLFRGRDLNTLLNNASPEIPTQRVSLDFSDPVLYIYTSGTTGLPKAANMPNERIILFCLLFKYMSELTTTDIFYSPLPLYHSSSGILGIGCAFFLGIPIVIRKKFSVTKFWKECIKYNCTAGHYIGEMCRYLVLAPETPIDRQHKIRKFIGNGIREKVWKTMIERFGVNDFREFYGSTEGNGSLINFTNKIGSVGFMPNLIPNFLSPFALLEYDLNTGLPVRDSKGFCSRVPRGQPGLYMPKIKANIVGTFYGYVNKEESEKKIIRDVFKKGDVYFNTGDILMRDNYGYFYFVDRIGDTYRWKGENVSSTEIENVLATVVKCELCVYGVEVSGCEGRAGMVVLVDHSNSVDIEQLFKTVKEDLPKYAVPLFIRFTKEMDVTATLKMKKINFQKEAYNIDIVKDPIYVLQNAKYVPLTREIYKQIQDEKFKF